MPTLVNDPQPVEFVAFITRRRQLGQDLLDEVWDGVYHLNPAPHRSHARVAQQLAVLLDAPARAAGLQPMMSIFSLGDPDDFRVPDGGIFRAGPDAMYVPTAALVVEIVSPGDETWGKLGFYAAHEVDELLVVEPQERRVHWLSLAAGAYEPVDRSGLVELGPDDLAMQIEWP